MYLFEFLFSPDKKTEIMIAVNLVNNVNIKNHDGKARKRQSEQRDKQGRRRAGCKVKE